jgi:hypothetical protein
MFWKVLGFFSNFYSLGDPPELAKQWSTNSPKARDMNRQ